MNNNLMIEKYYEQIGNDLKAEKESELSMQWLGVWIEAWRACERTLSPSQIAADLKTAKRGLAEYRATIERMVAEKEEMAAKLAELETWRQNQALMLEEYKRKETTEIEGWVSAIKTEEARRMEVYKRIIELGKRPAGHECKFCGFVGTHADNCLYAEAVFAAYGAGEL